VEISSRAVLIPVVFSKLVNHVRKRVSGEIRKFADSTKFFGVSSKSEGAL